MKIAVLGIGHIGSAVGRLWHSAGHETTFAGEMKGSLGIWPPNSVPAPTPRPWPTPWQGPASSSWPSPARP
jgi:hypothetical protein